MSCVYIRRSVLNKSSCKSPGSDRCTVEAHKALSTLLSPTLQEMYSDTSKGEAAYVKFTVCIFSTLVSLRLYAKLHGTMSSHRTAPVLCIVSLEGEESASADTYGDSGKHIFMVSAGSSFMLILPPWKNINMLPSNTSCYKTGFVLVPH